MLSADDRPNFSSFFLFKLKIHNFVAIFGFSMENTSNEYKQA